MRLYGYVNSQQYDLFLRMTFVTFMSFGTMPDERDKLNIIVKGLTISFATFLMIRLPISGADPGISVRGAP